MMFSFSKGILFRGVHVFVYCRIKRVPDTVLVVHLDANLRGIFVWTIRKKEEKVRKGSNEKHKNGEGKPKISHFAQSSYKPEQHAMVTTY